MKIPATILILVMLSGSATAAGVLEHFRNASNAYDFGECNVMLVLHDVTMDERPEVFLSHFEFRVGGVHMWQVYTPLDNGQARYLGNVDVHPRGLRVSPGQPGFLTYAGQVYDRWLIDAKGMHSDGSTIIDTSTTEAVPFWAQRCPEDGESFWAGAENKTLTDVKLDAEVVSAADALAEAAAAGDLDELERLLNDWVEMYAADNAGGAALLAAASAGRSDSLQFLFAQSDDHPTLVLRQAISAAAWHEQLPALEAILARDLAGARTELVQDALGSASQNGSAEAVRLLLAEGGNANASSSEWEHRTPLERASENQQQNVIEEFRAAGVDVDRAGEVALFQAIDQGDEEAVRRLVNSGVSPDSGRPGEHPTPALMWSIYARQPDITMALIELGADVNVTNSREDTPLTLAAGYEDLQAVNAMLDRGARAGAVNRIGTDVLTSAAISGNVDMIGTLLDRVKTQLPENATNRALITAAQGGHRDAVCLLLLEGADPTWKNELNRTAEVSATMKRLPDMVGLLQDWKTGCAANPVAARANGSGEPE